MIQTVANRVPQAHRATLVQLIRYGLAGGIITLLVALSYWLLAEYGGLDPQLSLLATFLFFSAVSYTVHGAFSFKDHGTRDRQHVRALRFMAVNLIGLALNQLFVWGLVKQLHGPNWWPTVPMVFVTPLVTFALHRKFVYA